MGTPGRKWGMAIDLQRCVGCWTCAIACKVEHNVPMGLTWNRILTEGGAAIDEPKGTYPDLEMQYIPVACQHCEDAPCIKVCPVSATYKRADGIVAIDYDRCIGCRYCMAACPYGVRVFNWGEPVPLVAGVKLGDAAVPDRRRGVVEKCDFCMERVDRGEQPFCVEVCPERARVFGDLNDPNSEVSVLIREKGGTQLLAEAGTRPQVYYLPRQRQRREMQIG